MSDYSDGAAGAAFLVIWFTFIFIFAIAGYIITSFFLMKIFEKAGVQGKWRAWVPIYNYMIFSKLGDLSPWLVLIAFGASILLGWIPVIGWVASILPLVVLLLAAWRVGLKLQKEAVWLILFFFLTIVWLGILAFDKSRWNTAIPPAPWAGNGFLADRTVWNGVPAQTPAGGYPVTQSAPGAYPPPAGYQPPPAPAGYAPPPCAGRAAGRGRRAAGDSAGRSGCADHPADEPAGTADRAADEPAGTACPRSSRPRRALTASVRARRRPVRRARIVRVSVER